MKKLFLAALVILGGFTVSACTTPINQIIGLDQNDIYAIEAISASELLTQSLMQSASTLSLAQSGSSGDLVLLDSTAGASTNPTPSENAPLSATIWKPSIST